MNVRERVLYTHWLCARQNQYVFTNNSPQWSEYINNIQMGRARLKMAAYFMNNTHLNAQ